MFLSCILFTLAKQLNSIISDETRGAEIDDVLGNLTIIMYIGGHSLGAHFTNALRMVQELGWGSETLVVNTEMAAQDLFKICGNPTSIIYH